MTRTLHTVNEINFEEIDIRHIEKLFGKFLDTRSYSNCPKK